MKKYIYRSASNKLEEYLGYDSDDFVTVAGPSSAGKPIKANSSGVLDPSFFTSAPASILQITRKASGRIDSGDIVYGFSATHVAQSSASTPSRAKAIGMAVADADDGEDVIVVLFGIVNNPIFSAFNVGSPLFLDVDGAITDERPVTGTMIRIGESFGSGDVFVQIKEPTILGA